MQSNFGKGLAMSFHLINAIHEVVNKLVMVTVMSRV